MLETKLLTVAIDFHIFFNVTISNPYISQWVPSTVLKQIQTGFEQLSK